MNIGIFLENFTDNEIEKDPGIITDGLIKLGQNVTIFSHSLSKKVSEKYETKQISNTQRNKISYWQGSGISTIIIYSWLSLRYSRMIKAASLAGLKVILKLDSDGYLIYPLKPSYLRVFGLNKSITAKIKHLMRIIQWGLLPRILSGAKIRQIERSDAIIIESPAARENINYSLAYWYKNYLSEKINVIPNPVSTYPINPLNKADIITCIGRWNDLRKNAKGLVNILSSLKTSWQINLIGLDSLAMEKKIKINNPDLSLTTIEKLSHKEIFTTLEKTKILFVPSLSESFNLAAAEALCCGCSIVGGPLPSFKYFFDENKSGSLARDFKNASLKETLERDIVKWEAKKYEIQKISYNWQQKLNPKKVSEQIIDLIKSIEI